jgi:hypothetical protein
MNWTIVVIWAGVSVPVYDGMLPGPELMDEVNWVAVRVRQEEAGVLP